MSIVKTWPKSKANKRKPGSEPWILLRIREGASAAGPWTPIDSQTWTDPDPANPQPIDIETENAALEAGWYQFQFQDASGDFTPWSDPVYWTESGGVVEIVSALVRARTRDDLGNELGVFTSTTRPTAIGVMQLWEQEAALVGLSTGRLSELSCPSADEIRKGGQQVVAKRVAAIIEASYRPDEVAQGRTVADFYQGDREDDLEALVTAADRCRAYDPGEPEGGGTSMDPVGFFPARCSLGPL